MDNVTFYYDSEENVIDSAKHLCKDTGSWPHRKPERFELVGRWQPNQYFPYKLEIDGETYIVRDYYNGIKIIGRIDDNTVVRVSLEEFKNIDSSQKIYWR